MSNFHQLVNCRRAHGSLKGAEGTFREPCTPCISLPWGDRPAQVGCPESCSLSHLLRWEVGRLRMRSPQGMGGWELSWSFSILYSSPPWKADLKISGASLFSPNSYIEILSIKSYDQMFFVSTPKLRVFYPQRNHLKSPRVCSKDVVIVLNIFSTCPLESSLEARTHSFPSIIGSPLCSCEGALFLSGAGQGHWGACGGQHRWKVMCLHTHLLVFSLCVSFPGSNGLHNNSCN